MSAADPGAAGGARTAESPDLALRLLLLALLLDTAAYWFQRVPVTALAGLGVLYPRALRSRWLWAALTLATAWPLVWNWPFSDNHDYLRALVCLAVALSLSAPSPTAALAWNARWLLGLTFAFAALWKGVLSPDYLDGTFFRVTLLSDPRFHDLALLASRISPASIEAFDAAIEGVLRGGAWEPGAFREPASFRALAAFMTGATLFSEAAIAVAFLWPPGRGWPHRLRHLALLGFAASTYAFATVRGFGWLLVVLGLAQCRARERWARAGYVLAFFLIEFYRSVPFSDALLQWWRPELFGPGG